MKDEKRQRLIKRLRLTARIIASAAAFFLLIFLVGGAVEELVAEDAEGLNIEGITLGLLGLVAVAGCIIAWRREKLGGIILMLVALGFGIHIAFIAGRNHFLAWLVIGFPYLLAGALFLYTWRLTMRDKSKT
jgi:hypothetical protein